MGEYVYRVSSKKINVIGLDKPVHTTKFLGKPSYSVFSESKSPYGWRIYGEKTIDDTYIVESFEEKIGNGDRVLLLPSGSNHFTDYGNRFWNAETIGFVYKRKNRWVLLNEEEHEEEQKEYQKELREGLEKKIEEWLRANPHIGVLITPDANPLGRTYYYMDRENYEVGSDGRKYPKRTIVTPPSEVFEEWWNAGGKW